MGKQVTELQKQVNALRNKMATESAATIARFVSIQEDMNKNLAALREELEAQATRNSENLDTFMDILTAEQERERTARESWQAELEAKLEEKFEARFQSIERKLAS